MDALRRLTKPQLFANIIDVADNDSGDEGTIGDWLGISAFGIAVAALVIFVVIDRAGNPGTVGLVLAVLALITVLAFWSNLPFAFGLPAAWLGARLGTEGRGNGTVIVGISLLAVVAALVLSVIG
jgi:hypothetical protein